MLKTLDTIGWYAAGLAGWGLLENVVHKEVGHDGLFSKFGFDMHQHHHFHPQGEDPDRKGSYLDSLTRMGPLAAKVLGALNVGFVPVLGVRRAAALSAGLLTGWARYEKLHTDIHNRPPREGNDFEQWAWRHHLAHHFKHPKANFNVTTPFWDHLRGTYREVDEVGIPASKAPPWLTEDMPGFKLKGKRSPTGQTAPRGGEQAA